jgi:hypothetical protein
MPIRTAQQICIIETPAMGLGKGVDAIWYPKGKTLSTARTPSCDFLQVCKEPLSRWSACSMETTNIFWRWPLRMIVGWEHSATDLIGADPDHLAGTEIGVLLTCPAGVRRRCGGLVASMLEGTGRGDLQA